ncbi:MAG: hypothetical protein HY737_05405 [Candidatus Omnitrophica bacterium]|nr:hypothetical protein [Candidatus Omnitrophota bacterium]
MRRRAAWWGLAALALAGFPSPAGADADRHPLKDFVKGATYTVDIFTSFFPQTFVSSPDLIVDDKAVIFWTKALAKSQATLADGLMLKLALYTAYSGFHDEFRGVFASPDSEKPYARYVDFKEASLRYTADRFALLLGRAPITVSLSTLHSPANRYRVLNLTNPMHPDDLGAWQTSLDWFLGDNTLRFSILPFEERSTSPFRSSRWVGESGENFSTTSSSSSSGGGATGLTAPEGANVRTVFRNRPGFLLKYTGVATSLDYFLTAHYGPGQFQTIQNPSENEFSLEIPSAVTLSAGAAKTQGGLELHGESLYQMTDENADQNFVRYVIGATYRETAWAERIGFDEISPVVEYAGEWVTGQQDNAGTPVNSSQARPFRNSLLFRVDVIPTDKLTFRVGGVRNFTTGDYTQIFALEYKPNYNLTWKAQAAVFGGAADTAFGRWNRNDYFEVGLTRTF